eukprot:Selendium_serpulae@DN2496_c0_g1_i1.p1
MQLHHAITPTDASSNSEAELNLLRQLNSVGLSVSQSVSERVTTSESVSQSVCLSVTLMESSADSRILQLVLLRGAGLERPVFRSVRRPGRRPAPVALPPRRRRSVSRGRRGGGRRVGLPLDRYAVEEGAYR